jgi:hypothetical protein
MAQVLQDDFFNAVDAVRRHGGTLLAELRFNARETPFKAACQSIREGSHYYRFDDLKRCYGYE